MCQVTICKIPKDGGESFYIVETEWHKRSFALTLLENGEAWTGNVTADQVNEFCERVGLNAEDYIFETRKALSSHNGAEQFCYTIEDKKFVWKKLAGTIKVRFGYIHLKKIPGFSKFEVLVGNVLDKIHTLEDQIKSLRSEMEYDKAEKENLMMKLDQFMTEKIKHEEAMYGNFLAILNAKKERISQLETLGPAKWTKNNISDSETECDEPQTTLPARRSSPEYGSTLPKRKCQAKSKARKEPVSCKILSVDQPDSSVLPSTSKPQSEVENGDECHYNSDTQVDSYDSDDNTTAVGSSVPPKVQTTKANVSDSTRSLESITILPKRVRRGKGFEQNKVLNVGVRSSINLQEADTQMLLDEL